MCIPDSYRNIQLDIKAGRMDTDKSKTDGKYNILSMIIVLPLHTEVPGIKMLSILQE